jgi:hypothetical protein
MAINQNHPFEELGGIKCAVVERNVSPERVKFLKELLELNKYEVVVVPSPPPKVAVAPKPAMPAPKAEGETSAAVPASAPEAVASPEPPAPETFTIGVTDVVFNSTNAVFGRLLRTRDGHVVTRDYWQQKDPIAHDDIPYYES